MPISAALVLFCPFRAKVPYTGNPGRCPGLLCEVAPSAHKIAALPRERKPMPRGDTSQIGRLLPRRFQPKFSSAAPVNSLVSQNFVFTQRESRSFGTDPWHYAKLMVRKKSTDPAIACVRKRKPGDNPKTKRRAPRKLAQHQSGHVVFFVGMPSLAVPGVLA